VIAWGEIGLDYHYDHSPRGDQRRAFRSQLQLAKRLGLPAVVHLRDAHDEGYAILEEEGLPDAGCVVHCFTDGPELAKRFLDLGCHISFAGPVTFGKADQIREAARLVPLDRLLVETDCPFMAPAPYRGRTNEPAWAVLNAVRIAEVKGMGATELAASLYSNAKRLFGGVA
jgi:TatD DNase family protein